MNIRRAAPQEAEQLSSLAFRSKAYWGYDEVFMQACRSALEVKTQDIERGSTLFQVCPVDDVIVGFYRVKINGHKAELDYLFVEPEVIGGGLGKALLLHAFEALRSRGVLTLVVKQIN